MASPALPPRITSILESVLYASDVPACAGFYRDVLGMSPLRAWTADSAAFHLAPGVMLLIFNPDYARRTDRNIPAHGTIGAGHVAFRVGEGGLDAWRAHLVGRGVAIEQEVAWPAGGRSIYVRDPAGNAVELAEGWVWTRGT